MARVASRLPWPGGSAVATGARQRPAASGLPAGRLPRACSIDARHRRLRAPPGQGCAQPAPRGGEGARQSRFTFRVQVSGTGTRRDGSSVSRPPPSVPTWHHCLRPPRATRLAHGCSRKNSAVRCAPSGRFAVTRRWSQPPRLRIQSAVPKKLSARRCASAGSTACSAIACPMQASHWSRSAMPMAKGRWRARSRGWPKRSV